MREIEFRGKRKSEAPDLDWVWVYGSLYHAKFWKTGNVLYKITPYEDSGESYHVHPETVGQYTGFTDKKGVKIFEGDIVRFMENAPDDPDICIGEVVFKNGCFMVNFPMSLEYLDGYDFEVTGNIHDNPELLEEVGNEC